MMKSGVTIGRILFYPGRAVLKPGGGGGGGQLGLEKGTNCGPTSLELWLSRAYMAKKGRLSSHYILPEGSCHSLEC